MERGESREELIMERREFHEGILADREEPWKG